MCKSSMKIPSMLNSLKKLLRFPLYIPLRLLRFIAQLAVLGCVIGSFSSFDAIDFTAWVIATVLALVAFLAFDLMLRWLGKPELL